MPISNELSVEKQCKIKIQLLFVNVCLNCVLLCYYFENKICCSNACPLGCEKTCFENSATRVSG